LKKSALVFGGSGEIGSAIADVLSEEDFEVVIADIAKPPREIKAHYVPADLTQEADVKRAIRYAQDNFGRIDVIINSQGVYQIARIENSETEDWDKIIDVNLKSVFLVCREAVKLMKWQKTGYIINIASMAGLRGKAGESVYSASKFGVIGLTKVLFEELRNTGVKVSAVCPASVDTKLLRKEVELTEKERRKILKPEDVAWAVMNLLHLGKNENRIIVPLDIKIELNKLQRKEERAK